MGARARRGSAWLATLLVAAPAVAQPALSREAPVVLRPEPALRDLAERAARILDIQLDPPVSVGEAPPPEIAEAVPSGHLALVEADGAIALVLGGPQGQTFRAELALDRRDPAAARTLALAIEALHDTALRGPPAAPRGSIVREGVEVAWVYHEPPGGLFGPRTPPEADAKPVFYAGLVGSLSTERLTVSVAPRVGLGLCLAGQCIVLEGDLGLIAEGGEACDHRVISYRSVTLALRGIFRPPRVGDFAFGGGGGIASRFGVASLEGVGVDRVVTSFGLRLALEAAWRFAGPFELALEVGLDLAVSPAQFVRLPTPHPDCGPRVLPETVFVEDLATVWSAVLLRVRP